MIFKVKDWYVGETAELLNAFCAKPKTWIRISSPWEKARVAVHANPVLGVRDRRIVRAHCPASLTKFMRELSSVRNSQKKGGENIWGRQLTSTSVLHTHMRTHTCTHIYTSKVWWLSSTFSTAETGAGGTRIPGQAEIYTDSCLTKQKSKDYRTQPLPICLLLQCLSFYKSFIYIFWFFYLWL